MRCQVTKAQNNMIVYRGQRLLISGGVKNVSIIILDRIIVLMKILIIVPIVGNL